MTTPSLIRSCSDRAGAYRTTGRRGELHRLNVMDLNALLQLGAACAIFIAAAMSAKSWALSPSHGKVALTMALYTAGNLLMLRLIRQVGMATAFSVSAVLQLIAVNVVAIAVYGERVGLVEGTGLVFAVLAIALITLGPRFG